MPDCRERQQSDAADFFDRADVDNSGGLSKVELFNVIKDCGYNKTTDEVASWFMDLDKDDDAKITKEEFLNELSKRPESEIQEADLRKAFKKFDADSSGTMSADELRGVVTDLGHNVTDEDLNQLMTEADKSGDGQISYEEFLNCWNQR